MATKIKMLKLLQEAREHAYFASRRPQPRPSGVLLWQLPSLRVGGAKASRKKTLTVMMQDPPAIPDPVTIKHLQASSSPHSAIT